MAGELVRQIRTFDTFFVSIGFYVILQNIDVIDLNGVEKDGCGIKNGLH